MPSGTGSRRACGRQKRSHPGRAAGEDGLSTDPGHGRHFSTGLRRAASTKESVAEMAGEVSQVSPAPWIWPLLGVSRSDNMPPIAIFTFQKVKADPIALLEFFDLTRDSSAGSPAVGFTAFS